MCIIDACFSSSEVESYQHCLLDNSIEQHKFYDSSSSSWQLKLLVWPQQLIAWHVDIAVDSMVAEAVSSVTWEDIINMIEEFDMKF